MNAVYVSIIIVCVLVIVAALGWYYKKPGSDNKPGYQTGYQIESDLIGDAIRPDSASAALRFYVGNDPTHGAVKYGEWPELVKWDPEKHRTVISVGEATTSGTRKSVRLVSKNMYNSGLFVIKADHIPAGHGVWPSFWLTAYEPDGSSWACNGEIDIIEGVNSVDATSSHNTSTLHTSDHTGPDGKPVTCRQEGVPGIKEPNCASGGGTLDSTCGCDSKSTCPYIGCGVDLKSQVSFGHGFNQNGGGTYACELTAEGAVTIWFFPKGTAPADIDSNTPNPANWSANNRTMFNPCPNTFKNLQLVINTTLCGDWAGREYPGGDPQKSAIECAKRMKDAYLPEAYWSIDYIKIFQQSGAGGVIPEPTPWRNSSNGPGVVTRCPDGTPGTAAGRDMFDNSLGCCNPCASGAYPYLIKLGGEGDGKYFCFADDAQAKSNNNDIIEKGPPENCGSSGNAQSDGVLSASRAKSLLYQSMSDRA